MPLSPDEALAKRDQDPEEVAGFKAACRRLDKYLTTTRWPAYWSTHDCSESVIEKIICTYSAKGWDVEVIYDARDGNCLKFEPRR